MANNLCITAEKICEECPFPRPNGCTGSPDTCPIGEMHRVNIRRADLGLLKHRRGVPHQEVLIRLWDEAK